MRRKGLIILLVMLAMVGCRPRDVLSNREMRDVLYDLHRMDGAIQTAGYNYGHSQELAAYYKSVLDKHGVTQAQFDTSLVWYTDNPQIFNKIYPRVIERLEADMERESALRDEYAASLKAAKGEAQASEGENVPMTQEMRRDWTEWVKIYRNGLENPWKEWKSAEFCEKDVIIFGQLKKK